MHSSYVLFFIFISGHSLGGTGNIFATILFASKLEVNHILEIIVYSIQLCCQCYDTNIQLMLLLLLISTMSTLSPEHITK